MIISVINHTNGQIQDEELQRVIRAINRQIKEDFAPYWRLNATLRLEGRTLERPGNDNIDADMRGDAILYLWNTANASSALGYHERNFRGIPYGFVFIEVAEKLKEDWTVTLSHEALEMIGDPETNRLVMGPHPGGEKRVVFHWFEVCDAVQGESYEIDGVRVSNFVLPLYFTGSRDVDEPNSRNDFLGRSPRLASFQVKAGGYVGYYDPALGEHKKHFASDAEREARRLAEQGAAKLTRRAQRFQQYAQRLDQDLKPFDVATDPQTIELPSVPFPITLPVSEPLGEQQLRPGDVLLSHRSGPLSKAIALFDDSEATAATLYLGNSAVLAVGRDGISRRDLDGDTSGADWVEVRRLPGAVKMEPVLIRAQRYLERGKDYLYKPELLLAFLALARKPKNTPALHGLLVRILETATSILARRIAEPRAPLFGSELVYRCFDEAITGGGVAFALKLAKENQPARRVLDSVRGRGIARGSVLEIVSTRPSRADEPRSFGAEVPFEQIFNQYIIESIHHRAREVELFPSEQLRRATLQFALAYYAVQHGGDLITDPRTAIENLIQTVKDFVSPGDLQLTPSLETVGQLVHVPSETTNHFANAWKNFTPNEMRLSASGEPSVSS
ncbi:MAG TPA: hypothetical protein VF618_07930 [Thermoanaerobaculia bacterium]